MRMTHGSCHVTWFCWTWWTSKNLGLRNTPGWLSDSKTFEILSQGNFIDAYKYMTIYTYIYIYIYKHTYISCGVYLKVDKLISQKYFFWGLDLPNKHHRLSWLSFYWIYPTSTHQPKQQQPPQQLGPLPPTQPRPQIERFHCPLVWSSSDIKWHQVTSNVLIIKCFFPSGSSVTNQCQSIDTLIFRRMATTTLTGQLFPTAPISLWFEIPLSIAAWWRRVGNPCNRRHSSNLLVVENKCQY